VAFALRKRPCFETAKGERDALFKLGQHQFLAMFETKDLQRDRGKHFGILMGDEAKIAEMRENLTNKYKIKLIPTMLGELKPLK